MGAPEGERTTTCGPAAVPGPVPAEVPLPRSAPEPGPDGSAPAAPERVLPDPGPAGSTAPPRRTHRWGLGAFVLVQVVFYGVSALIGFAFGGGLSAAGLILAIAVPTVLAAATAVVITRVRGNGPRVDLGLVWSWHDVGVGLVYGVAGLAVTIPAALLYLAIVGPDQAGSALGDVFAGVRAGPVAAVAVVLVVVLLAPLCEEIVYRGLLWGAVERRTTARWVPVVVTTLLFAFAHFELTRAPLLFVVALPLALARLKTGRLVASVVAHQVNNLLPGVLLALTLVGAVPV